MTWEKELEMMISTARPGTAEATLRAVLEHIGKAADHNLSDSPPWHQGRGHLALEIMGLARDGLNGTRRWSA